MLFSLVQIFGTEYSQYFCCHLKSNPSCLFIQITQVARTWPSPICTYEGPYPGWHPFSKWLPGHKLPFSTGNASISDRQQNPTQQKQWERREPSKSSQSHHLQKEHVILWSHPPLLVFSPCLLMIEISAFNCPCRNSRHWSFPICPLFYNLPCPLYAMSHPLFIFSQSKDQNPPLFLTPHISPVSEGQTLLE